MKKSKLLEMAMMVVAFQFMYLSVLAQETCETAVTISETVTLSGITTGVPNDNLTSGAMTCQTTVGSGGQHWYVYTSDIPKVVEITTCDEGTNFDTKIHVYTGSCGNLFCITGNDDYNCWNDFNLTSYVIFLAEPGVQYYFRIGGFASAQGQYGVLFSSEDVVLGCTNPTFCEYNPEANVDDGSCNTLAGCMDATSCNYNELAVCDDGSCIPSDEIEGVVFFDTDANGIWDEYDFPLSGLPVVLNPEGQVVYSNDNGQYLFSDVPAGNHVLQVNNNSGVWNMDESVSVEVTIPNCDPVNIAVLSSDYQFSVEVQELLPSLHCDEGGIIFSNIYNAGNLPLNGVITMTYESDVDFAYVNSADWVDPVVLESGFVQWQIADQQPGTFLNYGVQAIGPGVESIVFEPLGFVFSVQLFDDQGMEVYNYDQTSVTQWECAYDPNDKAALSGHYNEDHHFVLKESPIEYRIRFQNTGNAPANDVLIMDTLDLAALDISTFEPVLHSHDVMISLEPSGVVGFLFENINLPDSASDFLGSQGLVIYRVFPRQDSEHMDVIHNTAYIFFDGNPPIVTNTTWHTIMDCNELGTITGPEMICEGEMAEFTFPDDYVETIDWTVNEDEAGSGTPLQYSADTPGDFVVGVTVLNPLCEISQNTNLEVNALPGTVITLGDGTLTAPEGASWQWYYEDAELVGETNQTLSPLYSGYYTVLTTSEDGCTSLAEIIFIGITNPSATNLRFYPNPVSGSARLDMPGMENSSVLLYDASGRLVRNWVTSDSSEWLDFSDMPNGTYNLVLATRDKIVGTMPVVVAR